MRIGIKFCGGCNPRYDRGKAFEIIKKELEGKADFVIAEEGMVYDHLLVIGGCTNCCASYNQYTVKGEILLMWDQSHIETTIEKIKNM